MSANKRPLQVGDRVRLIGYANGGGGISMGVEGAKAEVVGITPISPRLLVKLLLPKEQGYFECTVYPSQCRRLVPPKKRLEIWVNEYENGLSAMWHTSRANADHPACVPRIRCVRFVEAKEKK